MELRVDGVVSRTPRVSSSMGDELLNNGFKRVEIETSTEIKRLGIEWKCCLKLVK